MLSRRLKAKMKNLSRKLKYYGKKFLIDNTIGKIFILMLAPILLNPSQFEKGNPANGLYRKLGFFVPIASAWLFSNTMVYTIRALMDMRLSDIGEVATKDFVRLDRALPFHVSVYSYIGVPVAVYIFSAINWLIHETFCFVLRMFGLDTQNVDLRYYIVKWSGRAAWFSVLVYGLGFAIHHLDFVMYASELAKAFVEKHPLLLLLSMFVIMMGAARIHSYMVEKSKNDMIVIYKSDKTYMFVLFVEIILGILFVLLIPQILSLFV